MSPSRFDPAFDVTARKGANTELDQDFRPTTLLEQSQMGGFDRTNKPVGSKPADGSKDGEDVQTAGGRNLGDTIAAKQLGADGRKK